MWRAAGAFVGQRVVREGLKAQVGGIFREAREMQRDLGFVRSGRGKQHKLLRQRRRGIFGIWLHLDGDRLLPGDSLRFGLLLQPAGGQRSEQGFQFCGPVLFLLRKSRPGQFQLGFIGVIEEGHHRKILAMGHRIVFVGVALGALQGEAQPGGAGGGHAVHHGVITELQGVDAAFLVLHAVAVETGGDALVPGGIRKEVAGDLFDGELIVRHVRIEGADHPVAVRPDGAAPVLFVTVGVRIAGKIQPFAAPLFAIARRGQQTVHGVRIGLRRGIRKKGGGFLHGGRQSCQVKTHPAEERGAFRFGGRSQAGLGQHGLHEGVHLIAHRPWGLHRSGNLREHGGLEGPVFFVFGPGGDPFLKQPDLFRSERLFHGRRRHHLIRIGGMQPLQDFAFRHLARHDRRSTGFPASAGGFRQIQAQLSFAALVVRPVAFQTTVGEQGPDVPAERGCACGRSAGDACGTGQYQQEASQMKHDIKWGG